MFLALWITASPLALPSPNKKAKGGTEQLLAKCHKTLKKEYRDRGGPAFLVPLASMEMIVGYILDFLINN